MGLSEKLVEIKNEADALITYANGVTGESDTRLGDAVRTLADGYGSGVGGEYSQAEYVSYIPIDSNRHPGYGFFTEEMSYPDIYTWTCENKSNAITKKLNCNNATGDCTQYTIGWNCVVEEFYMPKCTGKINQYAYRWQPNGNYNSPLRKLQLGSIGYAFTGFGGTNWFYGGSSANCEITFYVTATSLAELPNVITNYSYVNNNTQNSTIIWRNSTTGEILT